MDIFAPFMELEAIDMHAHLGFYAGFTSSEAMVFGAGTEEMMQRASDCNIKLTVASSLSALDPENGPAADVHAANEQMAREVEIHDKLRFYTVINPKLEGWEVHAEQMLSHPRCAGVKLHPRWNYWSVEEYGDRLFGFLHERKLLTLTHTGNAGNEPHRFIPFANRYSGVRLILAHIGHSEVGRFDAQVDAACTSEHRNVWADTSSMKSMAGRVIEHAVEQLGADRILFGTDSPLYFPAAQKARIAYARISDEAKHKIFVENATGLLAI